MTNHATEQEWWKERWLDALASFGRTLRSARAHNYARQGNVLKLDFEGNKIIAKVQGTAPQPYTVSISLQSFSDDEWQNVIEAMAGRAVFAAKLLAGEMPREIEEVFTANGLSLFPLTRSDIHSRCSCPDKANPCKHIGAVYYLLGDRFGADPFVLFQLRGRSRDQIIAALRQIRGEQVKTQEADDVVSEGHIQEPSSSGLGLVVDPVTFWNYDQQLEPSLVVITPPPTSETVLDVLGPIPLKPEVTGATTQTKVAVTSAMTKLTAIYQEASQRAVQLAMSNTEKNP
ncbi:MAG: SWIM zinc finger family protein [Cyanobacteria bacterium]|nr:SWIM zinc finger family protein [Cyanobacteriota bacterium]MDW8200458.1 SWIM zinc finger family protein [Cyanobacteriota bacterium SKYGB_h_bin112]